MSLGKTKIMLKPMSDETELKNWTCLSSQVQFFCVWSVNCTAAVCDGMRKDDSISIVLYFIFERNKERNF